ncbi:hypothetical protein PFFVO_02185 [Plasmodium falciparum Vietnam Oak-Knoll (FVO)]|uniref:Uncharacterized protein n=1 Tax=Plasmodium falciparum Vietnam Oak-Knoll (FVO) TaxID=1036723 RepID=A0A024V7H2_PLAFA|nr:hypothetical protein PFFVO_02185 [Plasmodium falciparum Vietnam Oak-Knoll (FVO)]
MSAHLKRKLLINVSCVNGIINPITDKIRKILNTGNVPARDGKTRLIQSANCTIPINIYLSSTLLVHISGQTTGNNNILRKIL